jgi:hypothetical protein
VGGVAFGAQLGDAVAEVLDEVHGGSLRVRLTGWGSGRWSAGARPGGARCSGPGVGCCVRSGVQVVAQTPRAAA